MKLVVFNGSPRKKRGHTAMLIESFLAGYQHNPSNSFELYDVQTMTDERTVQDIFLSTDYVLLAFPLYIDSMPGRVKKFIELLRPIAQHSREANPTLLFLVQSGFPEAVHSRYIEKYLQKLANRLNCDYGGTIVRGGVEWIHQVFPEFIGKKFIQFIMNKIKGLGKDFGKTGTLNKKMLKKIAYPEKLPGIVKIIYYLYSFIGIKYFGFDSVLKKNAVFQYRDATPYKEQE